MLTCCVLLLARCTVHVACCNVAFCVLHCCMLHRCAELGKFGVIMADPPWDIHMNLPYGTMKDDEMREMKVLQPSSLV